MSDTKTGGAAAAMGSGSAAAADALTGMARAAADQQSALWGEMTRMFSEMRFPSGLPDTGALLAAHRRNLDAFSAANRVALEGAQTVARRNLEIMQQTMTELTDQIRELASPGAGTGDTAQRQAELVRRAYERAVANIRELTELIQRSNKEALDLLQTRVQEAVEEVRGLLASGGTGGTGGGADAPKA